MLFAKLPGAVLTPAGDAVQHFGSPLREARNFDSGRAVVSLSNFGVLEVTGADTLRWLHSLTSQHLLDLQPGQAAETLLLDPNGKIEQQFSVLATADGALLVTENSYIERLHEFLERMRFTLRVAVANVSRDWLVCAVTTPPDATLETLNTASQAAEAICAAAPAALPLFDPWSWRPEGGVQYAAGKHPAAVNNGVVKLLVPAQAACALEDLVRKGSLKAAGINALDTVEVALWRPALAEFDDRALPHEFDLLRSSVHLNKGCYRGQETVAKVHNLGHPPRRLVAVHIDGSGGELPSVGSRIYVEGAEKPIGRITRAVLHYELGPIALALVKRAAPETGQFWVELSHGGRLAATLETIVPPDAGAVNALTPEQRRAFRGV
ncbi:YgfZ/GcvT domain-containing protein [Canibacter zhoujuaniae]|uniref:CAF17-like 4Fe-4S cluster assembly/insertion protein YgfZ n=1 Tax=Canibacter zhoujuaniae TaxID=2708343 RepID=UPI001421BDB0|nr:folate-binding protein YgfZ [Canibacter zhoujuaniae]